MTKRMTVRIRPDGSVEAETQGMKGSECLPYIEELEHLTGAQVVDSWYTEEFYEPQRGSQIALEGADERERLEGHG